jgi:hypothetical protein
MAEIEAGRAKLLHPEIGSTLNSVTHGKILDIFKKVGDCLNCFFAERPTMAHGNYIIATHNFNLSLNKLSVFVLVYEGGEWVKYPYITSPGSGFVILEMTANEVHLYNMTGSTKNVQFILMPQLAIDYLNIYEKAFNSPVVNMQGVPSGSNALGKRCIGFSFTGGVLIAPSAYSSNANISIIRSVDNGLNWEPINAPNANDWVGICHSPALNRFVAVAASGTNRMMYSNDNGLTWTAYASPNEGYQWTCIAWSDALNLFVAGTNVGSFAYSSTGLSGSWTIVAPATSKTWSGLCWSATLNLFVAVASFASAGTERVAYSSDGINWTLTYANIAADTNDWRSVAYSANLGLFVAVAAGGSGVGRIMTSTDGINWTKAGQSHTLANGWFCVAANPSGNYPQFVAVANSGTFRTNIMVSNDGFNWDKVNYVDGDYSYQHFAVVFTYEGFCVTGTAGNYNKDVSGFNRTFISNSLSPMKIIET